MSCVVLADNSADYRKSLLPWLRLEGYEAIQADSVAGAIAALRVQRPDLALVDLRLTDDNDENDLSGLQVAKTARDMGIPCIVITAFPSVEVTRLALRSRGEEPLAVDFVTKAAGPEALLDAIRDTLRQVGRELLGLYVDDTSGTVFLGQRRLELPLQHRRLLQHLYKKAGRPCTRQELLKAVYNEDVSPEDALDDKRLPQLVAKIREAIETDPEAPWRLVTTQDQGYILLANTQMTEQ